MGRRSRARAKAGKTTDSPVSAAVARPRIALGAPVAERAWILPQWFECLAKQTLQPEYLLFVYSKSKDDTEHMLQDLCPADTSLCVYQTRERYWTREQRNLNRKDPWRAQHMANLRNRLRRMFLGSKTDIFVSLDTDVLLQDETALERLITNLDAHEIDVACGLTYLHPLGEPSECYNVGYFGDSAHGDFDQAWCRAERREFELPSPVTIDVPMAFYAARRYVMERVTYKTHALGEDIGFAQNLRRAGLTAGWCTDVEGRHVWGPQYLQLSS